MKQHRFILEHYKGPGSRYTCPQCGKQRQFTRYIDTQTGQHLAAQVGICNRLNNCGYHYTPKQYFEQNKGIEPIKNSITNAEQTRVPTQSNQQSAIQNQQSPLSTCANAPESFWQIPYDAYSYTLKHHLYNHLALFLAKRFGLKATSRTLLRYCTGTFNHWPGATVFWQLDARYRLRSGKIILYNSGTGHRVKEPYPHITWAHTAFKMQGFNLKQGFFGEHLLPNNTKTVAIVESEKTALIASICMPQYCWLATGGANGCSWYKPEVCSILTGRKVNLYPDLNCYDDWSRKARTLMHIADFKVSDMLECRATTDERQHGLDLADYLLRG